MQRSDDNCHFDLNNEAGTWSIWRQCEPEIPRRHPSESINQIWLNSDPCGYGTYSVHYLASYARYAQRDRSRFDIRFGLWHCTSRQYLACLINSRLLARAGKPASPCRDNTEATQTDQWDSDADLHADAHPHLSQLPEQRSFLSYCRAGVQLLITDRRLCHRVLCEASHW